MARLCGEEILAPAMSAVGIGISIGSWSSTRDDSVFGNSLLVPAVPVALVAAALVFAALLWRRTTQPARSVRVAAAVAAALVLVQFIAMLLVPGLADSERLALGLVSTGLEGIASALLFYVYLASLTRYSPRKIAVTVAAGYLLVHAYDGLFLGASEAVRLAQRPIALLMMVVLGILLALRMGAVDGVFAWRRGEGRLGAADEAPAVPAMPSDHDRADVLECVAFACLMAVLLLVQGVYSQVTGLGSAGNIRAFNLFTELFAAGVRAAVLVWCCLRADDLLLSRIAALGAAVFLMGIPLVDLLWGTDAFLIGSHVINSARYILMPVVTIVGVQAARRHPECAAPLIFLALAVANSCYVSRLAMTVIDLGAVSGGIDAVLHTVSLCSLWIIACAIPAYMLYLRRLRERSAHDVQGAPLPVGGSDSGEVQDRASADTSVATAGVPAAMDSALAREIAFFQRLDVLCDRAEVTERERQILREVLHGYSVNAIAARMNLSASSVKTYLSRAYARFGVSGRQEVLELLDEDS